MKMKKFLLRSITLLTIVVTLAGFAFFTNSVKAQEPYQLDMPMVSADPQLIVDYWTPERMAASMSLDELDTVDVGYDEPAVIEESESTVPTMVYPGWSGQGPQPAPDEVYEVLPGDPLYDRMAGAVEAQPQAWSVPPTNPLNGPYGPFSRRTHAGRYLTYPRSTIGKLFFTLNGSDYVCSGSVIHRNTVMTSGRCNSDGTGTFATNRIFCPSYNQGGINTDQGCWAVVNSKTSNSWHFSADLDYDYACLITSTTGTIHNTSIGNRTGWLGRVYNAPAIWMVDQFGYPVEAPFPGYHIIQVASPEWYEAHFTAGGQISKFTGNDMTGGSEGGPWIAGWAHGSAEYGDTDGSIWTDPSHHLLNGVNSYRRCRTDCRRPPTATAGIFWQEMSSPPFRATEDGDEADDIINVCFNNGGT
jgi:hypothetical protein